MFSTRAEAEDPLLTPVEPEPAPSIDPGAPNRGPVELESGAETAAWWQDESLLALAGYGLMVVVAMALTAIALTSLWWMLYAWRNSAALQNTGFRPEQARALKPGFSFTLMVPARHEEAVLAHTLERLVQQNHPYVEILAIIGHDDPGTEAVAREVEARYPERVRVVIDDSVPKNKPKALNRALQTARGEIVGIFDAEDDVHPELLRLVDERFTTTGADVVQGGVQLMNIESSWWSLRNVLEYYFWFRSRLHFHAEQRFIPLGGNTVFLRTEQVREAGGWDAQCLAEDCEIGVRLSSQGARAVVAYDPEFATREETPGSLYSLFKQRTRWCQGFLQVLRKGEWRKLPTRSQRLMARYMLSMPFLQAFTGLLIPIAVVLILFAKVPPTVAMLTFLPLVPTVMVLAVEVAGLGEFGRVFNKRVRIRDYLRLILGTFPYQIFLAAAAIRSVLRELRGERGWEKTEHTGAHIDAPAAVARPASPAAPIALPASPTGPNAITAPSPSAAPGAATAPSPSAAPNDPATSPVPAGAERS